MVIGEVKPVLSLGAQLVKALLVFVLRIRVPVLVAAEGRIRVLHQFPYVCAQVVRIRRVVRIVPVIVQRLAIVGVNFLVRQPMPSVARRLVRMDGILTLAAGGVAMTVSRRVVTVRDLSVRPISRVTPAAIAMSTGIAAGWLSKGARARRVAVAKPMWATTTGRW
ncbi:hypothetical protein A5775_07030 [Mycobacterium sp. 852002-10029_SCH5224772]|nr:hypothetical protein A5775_07030 [Mycobacterium sp. 852002-10029_SCH5224772]